jgi:Mrp family chromosome partitioning ATPase
MIPLSTFSKLFTLGRDTAEPTGAVAADAIRLCGALRATLAPEDRVILAGSAFPREGVTTILTQLGRALAVMTREPVLLIDSNLRHPSLHQSASVASSPGLLDFVRGRADFDAVIHSTSLPSLSVVPAGDPEPAAAAELLQHPNYASLLRQARDRFRYVLLDSAPLLRFPDAVLTLPQVDGALLVLASPQRTKAEASELMRLLQGLNAKVFGAVLSRA